MDEKADYLFKVVVDKDRVLKVSSPTGKVDSGIAFDIGQMLLNLARNTVVTIPENLGETMAPVPSPKNVEA